MRHRIAVRLAEDDPEAQLTGADVTIGPRAHPRLAAAAEHAHAFRHPSPMIGAERIRLVPGLAGRIDRQRGRHTSVVDARHAHRGSLHGPSQHLGAPDCAPGHGRMGMCQNRT